MQYGAVQSNIVQCSAKRCDALKCSTVHQVSDGSSVYLWEGGRRMEEAVVTALQEVFSSIEERLGWSVFTKALFWAMCIWSKILKFFR